MSLPATPRPRLSFAIAWSVLAVSALVSAPARSQAHKDPKDEFRARWTALAKRVAQQHAALGKKFADRKMHELAWDEWQRAVAIDATNADAQRALGRKLDKEKGAWVDTAATKPKKNEGKDTEVQLRAKECADDRAAMASKAISDFEALAIWAESNGLKDDAKSIWQRILRDYDATNERALKGDGFVQVNGHWLSPEEAAKREEDKKKVDTTPDGDAVTEPSQAEKTLGWTLVKRRGPHVFLEGAYTEEEMKELVRVCEATRAHLVDVLALGPNGLAKPMHGILLKEQAPYQDYVERLSGIDAADKPGYKGLDGYVHRSRMEFIHVQGKHEWADVKDETSHLASHLLLYQLTGQAFDPPWLQEGLAYWLTERLLQTALTHCVRLETSASGGREVLDVLDWKNAVKQSVAGGTSPPLREVMLANMTTLSPPKVLKAWSVVDFLLTQHREVFLAFAKGMKAGQPQEEALSKAFGGKTLVEIEALWLGAVKD